MTEVISMQKVNVKGQGHRGQNLTAKCHCRARR